MMPYRSIHPARNFILLLGLALLMLGQSVAAAPLTQAPSYHINLHSRQFTPAPGVERETLARATSADKRHVLLQLQDIPSDDMRQALEAQGIRLLNYIPDRAWFATIETSALSRLNEQRMVRWLGEIQVADKLPARLLAGQFAARTSNADGSLNLILAYFADVTTAEATAVVRRHSGEVIESAPAFHRMQIRIPAAQLQALAAADAVRWLDAVPPTPTPQNDSIRQKIRATLVHAAPYNLSGAGIKLGIWDCGAVGSHIDFTGRLTFEPGLVGACNHGTHVAGTMAGSGANSQAQGGSALQWKGIAPGAQIVSYDYNGSLINEVQTAINTLGLDAINNSWGITPDQNPLVEPCHTVFGNYSNYAPQYDQIVYGSGLNKQTSIVFAVGNYQEGILFPLCSGFTTLTPPGTAKNVITVGAINANDDSMPAFSSWGPTDDGRTKPDVVAPGSRSDFVNSNKIRSTLPNDVYGDERGTSMAAPAVTGLTALLMEQYRLTTSQPLTALLPSTLKALVIQGAVDLGNAGPDFKFGFGRVDAKNSVDLMKQSRYRQNELANFGVITYPLKMLGCETSLRTTLVWDDVAATENQGATLINDLDLRLIAPNNVSYYPWQLDPLNPNAPATRTNLEDHRNNVEQVEVTGPITAGIWTVRVGGIVPQSAPQKFSLTSEAFNVMTLQTISPSLGVTNTQAVLYGDFGVCYPGSMTVAFGGGVTVPITSANWSSGAITVTIPSTATSGNVIVSTPQVSSNALAYGIKQYQTHLPLIAKNFPPPFNWIEASVGGTAIITGAGSDDITATVTLPSPFNFYGNSYTSVHVSANGFISFNPMGPSPNSSCIPTTTTPNNAVYAFWTDLDPSGSASPNGIGGTVWTKVVNGAVVIEWQNVPRYSTADYETFEIILNPDHSIHVQYLNVTNLNDIVVGVENNSGTQAIATYCNSLGIGNGIAPTNNRLFYYKP